MPTYEYVCESCGHRFDEFQSFKDEPLKLCPNCSELTLRRLFGTGAAILFKGSGFYETDYRSDSYKKAAKAESDSSTKSNDGKPTSGNNIKSGDSSSSNDAASTKSNS